MASTCLAGEPGWIDIPVTEWKGALRADVPALKRTAAAVVASPAKEASALSVASAEAQPGGLYEIRLTLRPSHAADAIAFNAGFRVISGHAVVAEFLGQSFARPHQPETRTLQVLQSKTGPLEFRLEAFAQPNIVDSARTRAGLKQGGPELGSSLDLPSGGDMDMDFQLELSLTPARAVYYLVDKIEMRPLSRSGRVTAVSVDKIRYLPGATLKGAVTLVDVGGKGGAGTVTLYLEHNLKDRTKVKSLPVKLTAVPQELAFEIPLPQEELGYALVAEYASPDGADRNEVSEYFSIAANFQRVAIFGGGLVNRDAILEEEPIRRGLAEARADYFNACEYFAWAEDDMVAMSPSNDFWSSGQTNYRMHKPTLQRQIRLAHEQGIAVSTYGKFVMSGLKGWETVYDYPNDHRGQYFYHVGMWESVNVPDFDRRRNQDFNVWGKNPNLTGHPFYPWWASFLPINPDATPRMVRIAAEECVRSIGMFGWDAIRWDGHPRAGGQCGSSGQYIQLWSRQTQMLMRYFKEIVGARYPDFRHGYNYLLIEPDKKHDWAVEDFELDELCRGGGLLMNESIGNASGGYTFAAIARNLQVDGDLSRERGGYYLGISLARTPRDQLIEGALWAAAGCRPYNNAMSREVRRYCTRYSQYTFDERLRRLVTPEKVLVPQAATTLWWQPFVYETPQIGDRRQLVINLLNVPQQARRPARDAKVKPEWEMSPGTDPVTFTLTLPAGLRATGVSLIDPLTLAVRPLVLKENRFEVPAMASWGVAVVDLAVEPGAPSLAALYGPPNTLGAKRPELKAESRCNEVVLDPSAEVWEVNKRVVALTSDWKLKFDQEQVALDALSGEAFDKTLLAQRPTPESLISEWWKGAALPQDLALKTNKFEFGNLAPRRNGRFDIFYARGAMDYRLRLPLVFAGLDRFRVHDAPLGGNVRFSPGMSLANAVPWSRYPEFDVLLFTGIPHCAIGVENSYALVEYVKAGGAAFFTGGEYAFGKGGYMHTVLDRDLLPLICTKMQDTVYSQAPRSFGPGRDFSELNVKLDFGAKPAFWVRNQVVLKPGAKVFLESDGRPILVGWTLGKGRVACLLLDHRGHSEKDVTAYFDWQDWPRLAGAVLRWLSPEAGRSDPPPPVSADVKAGLQNLQGASAEDELSDLTKTGSETDLDLSVGGTVTAGRELKGKALTQRLALIDRALACGGPEMAAALVEPLATVGSLPIETRLRMLALLSRERPASAAEFGRSALRTSNSALHGSGYGLLALAGDPGFAKLLANPESIAGEGEAMIQDRQRDLALAVVLYPKPDLAEEGRRRVSAWNQQEQVTRAAFAQACGPDTAMLETSPCLDAEALFQRLAWLAYLARIDAKNYGAAFVREWLMVGQYLDYCERSIGSVYALNLCAELRISAAVTEARVGSWRSLSARFGAVRELTRPDLTALLKSAPDAVAEGFVKIRFTLEFQAAMNWLGDQDRAATAGLLSKLKTAANPDLAAFATARESFAQ